MTVSAAVPPWRQGRDGLSLDLKVVPNAKQDRLAGLAQDAEGRPLLLLRCKAPPVDGKANAAVIAFLAKALGCPRSALEVTAGATSRQKRIAWRDAPDDALERLEALLASVREGS